MGTILLHIRPTHNCVFHPKGFDMKLSDHSDVWIIGNFTDEQQQQRGTIKVKGKFPVLKPYFIYECEVMLEGDTYKLYRLLAIRTALPDTITVSYIRQNEYDFDAPPLDGLSMDCLEAIPESEREELRVLSLYFLFYEMYDFVVELSAILPIDQFRIMIQPKASAKLRNMRQCMADEDKYWTFLVPSTEKMFFKPKESIASLDNYLKIIKKFQEVYGKNTLLAETHLTDGSLLLLNTENESPPIDIMDDSENDPMNDSENESVGDDSDNTSASDDSDDPASVRVRGLSSSSLLQSPTGASLRPAMGSGVKLFTLEHQRVMYHLIQTLRRTLPKTEHITYYDLLRNSGFDKVCANYDHYFNQCLDMLTKKDIFGNTFVTLVKLPENSSNFEIQKIEEGLLTSDMYELAQIRIVLKKVADSCITIHERFRRLYNSCGIDYRQNYGASSNMPELSTRQPIPGLNKRQSEAVRRALSTREHPVVFVSGVPGSGKTHIIESIIRNYKNGSKTTDIAILTHYGKMVENLTDRLSKHELYDASHDITSEHSRWSVSAKNSTQSYRLILTTIHSVIKERNLREDETRYLPTDGTHLPSYRDVIGGATIVIVDECQNVPYWLFASLLTACKNAKKFVLIGDVSQARPIDTGMPYINLSRSFPALCVRLEENYRMLKTPQSTHNMLFVSAGKGRLTAHIRYTSMYRVSDLRDNSGDFIIYHLEGDIRDVRESLRHLTSKEDTSTLMNEYSEKINTFKVRARQIIRGADQFSGGSSQGETPPPLSLCANSLSVGLSAGAISTGQNSSENLNSGRNDPFYFNVASLMEHIGSERLPFDRLPCHTIESEWGRQPPSDKILSDRGLVPRTVSPTTRQSLPDYGNDMAGLLSYLYETESDPMLIGCVSPLNETNDELNLKHGELIRDIMRRRMGWRHAGHFITKKFDTVTYKLQVGDKILFKENYTQRQNDDGSQSGPVKNNSSDWIVHIDGNWVKLYSGKWILVGEHIRLGDIRLGYFTTVDSSMGTEYATCLFYIPLKLNKLVGLFDRYKLLVAISRSTVRNIVVGHSIRCDYAKMSDFYKECSLYICPSLKTGGNKQMDVLIDVLYMLELFFLDIGMDPSDGLLSLLL